MLSKGLWQRALAIFGADADSLLAAGARNIEQHHTPDTVPDGYWDCLEQLIREAPLADEDECPTDPESLL